MNEDEEEQPQNERDGFNSHLPFPQHDQPRVWLLTAGDSPIAVALTRQLIEHGDYVVSCVAPVHDDGGESQRAELKAYLEEELADNEEARDRIKVLRLDIKSIAECQATVAEGLNAFDHIDIILCCNSEALIGTIEELAQTPRTQSLITDQFATNFFGPVNIIKSVLPSLRSQRRGHVILLTGITGHLGTPGLGMYCASQWAIEGYCDSLAYEIAPFNIKLSIVQPNIEIPVLTNRITAVPPMEAYSSPANSAPLARGVWGSVLDRLHETSSTSSIGPSQSGTTSAAVTPPPPLQSQPSSSSASKNTSKPSTLLNGGQITSIYPRLMPMFRANLIAETVHVILAIGGHENPPSRHIVGHEGVASVKEKLRTVSEELEDFVEVSAAVDL